MRRPTHAFLFMLVSTVTLLSACALLEPAGQKPEICRHPRNTITSFEIYFPHGSTSIDKSEWGALDRLITDIGRHKPKSILITGHTDLSGPHEYNRLLAQKRAQKIAKILTKRGVSSPITTESCGESDPSIPTQDNVKFLENRRVVVSLLK